MSENNFKKESPTILVVDDEKEIAELVEIHLRAAGYNVIKLCSGFEPENILHLINKHGISLALLDIMLPGKSNGIDICAEIRAKFNIPIIMLTAKSAYSDKIAGLSAGADDYVAKPFHPLELTARVRAQLRRFINLNPSNTEDEQIEIGGLIIDRNEHTVSLYGKPLDLTPMEFDILYLLVSNLGKVFSAEDIFTSVWKEKYLENSNNTIMVHIRHIREKLGDNGRNPRYIKTVWGVGYKIDK